MAFIDSPVIGSYKHTGYFRVWCQKVLPLVYDDSLSYYELLCKVVHYLNNVIQNVDTLGADVAELARVFEELKTYINDFLDSDTFRQAISDKLDEYAADGTLSALVNAAMRSECESLRKKILAMTGTLNETMRDERETNIRVLRKVQTMAEDTITGRRIAFRRGGSNFTVSMFRSTATLVGQPQMYGLINYMRDISVSPNTLYKTDYRNDNPDLAQSKIYVDGILKDYEDFTVGDLFSNLTIIKAQNVNTENVVDKWIITVIDSASIRIYMKYLTAPTGDLPRIGYTGGNWSNLYIDQKGMQIVQNVNNSKIITVTQDPSFEADNWHCVTLSW